MDATQGTPARLAVTVWPHEQPDGQICMTAELDDGRKLRVIGPASPYPWDVHAEIRKWLLWLGFDVPEFERS
jgi:hypothetical protein